MFVILDYMYMITANQVTNGLHMPNVLIAVTQLKRFIGMEFLGLSNL